LRIEYSLALLREVRTLTGAVDAFGVLYGMRHGNTVRPIATRGRTGLEAVGIFASRVRGKVSLTEEDLERFEKADALVALVISNESAGFFVRDSAGSIVTVRSYEEFPVREQPVALPKKKRRWHWAACLALIPLAFLLFKPHHPPLALTLRETGGQLRISWNRPSSETLTILDGGERTYVTLAPSDSSATYARRTGDVTVGIGATQARFLGPPLPPSEMETKRARLEVLRHKIALLRATKLTRENRIAELQRRLQ
jgi:hypothetical protein